VFSQVRRRPAMVKLDYLIASYVVRLSALQKTLIAFNARDASRLCREVANTRRANVWIVRKAQCAVFVGLAVAGPCCGSVSLRLCDVAQRSEQSWARPVGGCYRSWYQSTSSSPRLISAGIAIFRFMMLRFRTTPEGSRGSSTGSRGPPSLTLVRASHRTHRAIGIGIASGNKRIGVGITTSRSESSFGGQVRSGRRGNMARRDNGPRRIRSTDRLNHQVVCRAKPRSAAGDQRGLKVR